MFQAVVTHMRGCAAQNRTLQNRMFFAVVTVFITAVFVIGGLFVQHAHAEEFDQAQSAINAYMHTNSDKLLGVCAAAVSGEHIVAQGYYGYSDIERGVKTSEDTVYEWGTTSELLVWIAVLQLEEQGKLDLTSDIRMYLPADFAMPLTSKTPLTLQTLMNHTSGFDANVMSSLLPGKTARALLTGDELRDTQSKASDAPVGSNERLRVALQAYPVQQTFEPGTVVARSPYAASLAAYIVARVSGVDYATYVRQHIFLPMRMYHTAVLPDLSDNAFVKEKRAFTTSYSSEGVRLNESTKAYSLYPAYAVVSTLSDAVRLMRGLLDVSTESLFEKSETYDKFFETDVSYNLGNRSIPRVASGLLRVPFQDDLWYLASTTTPMTTVFELNNQEKTGVVVMANVKDERSFAFQLPSLLFGRTLPKASLISEDPHTWQGVYQFAEAPQKGPTKLLSYFSREMLIASNDKGLYVNGVKYNQMIPGVYAASVPFALDRSVLYVSDSYRYQVIISYPDIDGVQIPFDQFVFETVLLGCAGGAFLLFVLMILAKIIRKLMPQRARAHRSGTSVLGVQRFGAHRAKDPLVSGVWALNFLFMICVVGVFYAMTRLAHTGFLLPFQTVAFGYTALAAVLVVLIVRRFQKEKLVLREKISKGLAVFSLIVVVMNLLYWDIIF